MIYHTRNKGYSLLEVMVSIVLIIVIVLSTVQFFSKINEEVEKGERSQLAWINMGKRMERALEYEYHALLDSMPEHSVSLVLDGLQAYRSTYVTMVDDPLDGLAPLDKTLPDYLSVTIKFAWFDPSNVTDSLSCSFSEERFWNY